MGHEDRTLRDKKEFLRRLYESPAYRRALDAAPDDVSRRRVAAFATEFVSSFADVIAPMVARAQSDSAFVHELNMALVERRDIVTTTTGRAAASGSAG